MRLDRAGSIRLHIGHPQNAPKYNKNVLEIRHSFEAQLLSKIELKVSQMGSQMSSKITPEWSWTSLGCSLGSFGVPLGVLGAFGGPFGTSLGHLESLWLPFVSIWGAFVEPSGSLWGAFGEHSGSIRGAFGRHLGSIWGAF